MNLALGVSAFIGMLVHTFFDGVAIGAGFSVSRELGFLVFLAMFLHKIPDGFTIASIVRSTGHTSGQALAASTLLGISTLLGVVAFYAAGAPPFALPLAAGCTLYVAATDLMPEVNREHGVKMALLVFAGMGLFLLVRSRASASRETDRGLSLLEIRRQTRIRVRFGVCPDLSNDDLLLLIVVVVVGFPGHDRTR